jgi:hypothetical protein
MHFQVRLGLHFGCEILGNPSFSDDPQLQGFENTPDRGPILEHSG